jgi:hypothetical protein
MIVNGVSDRSILGMASHFRTGLSRFIEFMDVGTTTGGGSTTWRRAEIVELDRCGVAAGTVEPNYRGEVGRCAIDGSGEIGTSPVAGLVAVHPACRPMVPPVRRARP